MQEIAREFVKRLVHVPADGLSSGQAAISVGVPAAAQFAIEPAAGKKPTTVFAGVVGIGGMVVNKDPLVPPISLQIESIYKNKG